MKIHSDILTIEDVRVAAQARGMTGVHADAWFANSRKREFAFEVRLTGTSTRRPNQGNPTAPRPDAYAATWDEWGMFFAALYHVDPDMLAGPSGRPAYASEDAFHAATGDRFRTLTAPYQHGGGGHKWESADGIQQCKFCEATYDLSFMYVRI